MNDDNSIANFWREQGTGIMIMVRLPDSTECAYMGAAHGDLRARDLEQAIQWLQGLKGGIVNV